MDERAAAEPHTAAERRVLDALAAGGDEIVALAAALISYDTTGREGRGRARQEAPLQEFLASRLVAAGAQVDLWEPDPAALAGSALVPPDLDWAGYPQLLARFPGSGGGRCLLLNGHIDVVSAEPRQQWTSDPFRAEVRDGLLHGRGAVDMKAGLACIVSAAQALARCGVRLAGDLVISTVTDEESTGAGGVAAVARGVRADGCIVAEPTSLRVGIGCRGSELPSILVRGRAGHAAAVQPPGRDGGAVSAVEKAARVIDSVAALRETWRDDPGQRHPFLPPGTVVVTGVSGGQWPVSYADWCRVDCHLSYLPSGAGTGAGGPAGQIRREFTDWVRRHAAADPWLAAYPPQITWPPGVPPSIIDPAEPVVRTLQQVLASQGRETPLTGADYWNDGATFIQAGIPSVVFGPGHVAVAHSVDEHVPVSHLIPAAQAIALTAMRFCGPGA